MGDLVDKLREAITLYSACLENADKHMNLLSNSADEIERLRSELAKWEHENKEGWIQELRELAKLYVVYRQSLKAQPAQSEPVAWMHKLKTNWVQTEDVDSENWIPLYTTPQPSAEVERGIERMIDMAMIEMQNIDPPLRRSECRRLILAAMQAEPTPQPSAEMERDALMQIRAFVDQTYGDLVGTNQDYLAARYADTINQIIDAAMKKG